MTKPKVENERKGNLVKHAVFTSKYHSDKLRDLSSKTKIPMTKLISIALDNEMERENAFEFDLTIPRDEEMELAYADQGGKLLTFIKNLYKGLDLTYLVMLRYDIGIPDRTIFLTVFGELLDNGIIEAYKPPTRRDGGSYPDDYSHYRIAPEKGHETARKRKNKATEYETYLKLKTKFESEE